MRSSLPKAPCVPLPGHNCLILLDAHDSDFCDSYFLALKTKQNKNFSIFIYIPK